MIQQSWIPIGQEFRRLRAEFAETYGEGSDPLNQAETAILNRLASGFLTARAEHCLCGADGARKPETYFTADQTILPSFWRALIEAHDESKQIEWVTGDFSFEGCHYNVGVGLNSEPFISSFGFESTWFAIAQGVQIEVQTTGAESKPKSRGGRNPATWWQEFAMELAVYMHNLEYPEGEEGAGQEEVYKALCLRMGADNQPSRTNALDVIGKVLKRVRAPKPPAS